MNALSKVFAEPCAVRLGLALLHFLWQGAAVAALLAVLLRLLRGRSANVRYLVATAGLLVMAALPVATFLIGDAPAAPAPIETSALVVEVSFPPATPPTPGATSPVTPPPVMTEAKDPPSEAVKSAQAPKTVRERWDEASAFVYPYLPQVVAAWAVGVFLLVLWRLAGWTQLRRLTRRNATPVSETLQARLAELAHRLRVSRPVRLLESGIAAVPTVIGWLRPVVLLPTSALTGLSTEQIEAILAHELAHVRRHDYLVNLGQIVIETLLFYHPAVWWVSKRIRAEREHCCDDLAVSVCKSRATYARALATMEELRSAPRTAVAATGGNLLMRIRRIAGIPVHDDAPRGTWLAAGVVLTALMTSAFIMCQSAAEAPMEPRVAELVAKLSIPDEAVWKPAVAELIKIGPSCADAMARTFARGGPADSHAMQVLEAMAKDPHVQEVMTKSLSSKNTNVVHCSLLVLMKSGNREHVKAIAPLLKDHPIAASIALGELGGDEAFNELRKALAYVPASYLGVVAQALERFERPEAVTALKESLSRLDAETVLYAFRLVEAIHRIEKTSGPPLNHLSLHAVGDRNWGVLEAYNLNPQLKGVNYVNSFGRTGTEVETRAKAYKTLTDAKVGHLAWERTDVVRLLAFQGLKLAPTTLSVPKNYDLWGDSHRFFHQTTLAKLVEDYNQAHAADLAGTQEGMRAYPFKEGDQFVGLLPDGRVVLVKGKSIDDQTVRGTRYVTLTLLVMELDPLYQLVPVAAYEQLKPEEAAEKERLIFGAAIERGLPPPELLFVSLNHSLVLDQGAYLGKEEYWLPDGEVRDRREDRLLLGRFSLRPNGQDSAHRGIHVTIAFPAGLGDDGPSGSLTLIGEGGLKSWTIGDCQMLIDTADAPLPLKRPVMMFRTGDEYAGKAPEPPLPDKGDLELGYSQGPWREVAVVRPGDSQGMVRLLPGIVALDGMGICQEMGVPEGAAPGDFYVKLSAARSPEETGVDYAIRIELKDSKPSASGTMVRTVSGHRTVNGQERWFRTTAMSKVKPDEVRAVHILTRPWKTLTWRNVSLKPGHRTQVEVVAAKPATPNYTLALDFHVSDVGVSVVRFQKPNLKTGWTGPTANEVMMGSFALVVDADPRNAPNPPRGWLLTETIGSRIQVASPLRGDHADWIGDVCYDMASEPVVAILLPAVDTETVEKAWAALCATCGERGVMLVPGKVETKRLLQIAMTARANQAETVFGPVIERVVSAEEPGKHTVRVAFTAQPTEKDAGKPVRVISNPVEIDILPDEAKPAAAPAGKSPARTFTDILDKEMPADQESLLKLVQGDTKEKGFWALLKLREAGDAKAVPVLEKVLVDNLKSTRIHGFAAAQALFRIGTPEAHRILAKYLLTRDYRVPWGIKYAFSWEMKPAQRDAFIERYHLRSTGKELAASLQAKPREKGGQPDIELTVTLKNQTDEPLKVAFNLLREAERLRAKLRFLLYH